MARSCPFCSTKMEVETFEGIELDECPNCGAVWFQEDELIKILQRDPAAMGDIERRAVAHIGQRHEGASKLLCPDDQILLDKYHYLGDSPVVLHSCSRCHGMLVADGDLAKMEQLRGRVHRPMDVNEQAALLVGQATIERDKLMSRQANLKTFYNMLNQNSPGWIGLV